ncbi:TonB-dependent receptor plug domain-containing protein [Allomuricauda sp. F6463D]|uniref:TonB-dependent receptor n=1 Tax=Allomuricauda sp. F6463D TaxID=2926409 RepID=UPI001FF16CA8|nr:TonB-dependent receptor plug domain-containing protein [Muricauda sp. F6463D]MCK0159634.1 TonB-dependent receptor [Muricauda sp. F6463D]
MLIIKVIIFLASFLCCFSISAQTTDEKVDVAHVIHLVAKAHNITFNYKSDLLQNVYVTPLKENQSLIANIKSLEEQTHLVFTRISDKVIAISKTVTVCGHILDGAENPLYGATIHTKNGYTVADEDGYFTLEARLLDAVLTIRFIGFKTVERKAVDFDLENCDYILMEEEAEALRPVTLNGYLIKGIDKHEDGSIGIDYNKFTLLPGLIESDVLHTVQALPSVLSVDETVSNINIRGGSHDQNLILWDGIKMYQSSHFFGLISSFNPLMTQTATVINNGTDASYTDGVSGTIDMQSNKAIAPTFEGSFGVNLLNADVFLNIPFGTKSSVQVAARKSIDALVRTPTYSTYFERVTQHTEVEENTSDVSNSNHSFDFYDTSLRWLYKPSEKDYIRLNALWVNNDLTFDESAFVNGSQETKESRISQHSISAGLHYKRQWNNKVSTVVNVYNTDYKLQAINANIMAEQRFLQENIVSETSVKAEGFYSQNQWRLNLGYNFIESKVTNLNDIDEPIYVRRDEEVVREQAAFAQAQFQNENKDITVKVGSRVNYIKKFNVLLTEPRLSIRKALGKHFELEALGEFKHQNTSQIINFQNDFLGVEKRRWQLTDNDSIPIIKSKQASVGLLYKNKGWLLDAKAYVKNVDGITTQSQGFTTKYEFEKEQGSYDIIGAEFLMRKNFNTLSTWLSYSYMQNTYHFEKLEDTEFPSNFDITHAFTLGSTYSSNSWNISAGLNYRTGKPTSIPMQGNEVIEGSINFDTANNERLLYYFRIDASTLYKFKINRKLRSEIGVSVWNITNFINPINNYYRINAENSATEFTRYSLGTTTNAILRLYF